MVLTQRYIRGERVLGLCADKLALGKNALGRYSFWNIYIAMNCYGRLNMYYIDGAGIHSLGVTALGYLFTSNEITIHRYECT